MYHFQFPFEFGELHAPISVLCSCLFSRPTDKALQKSRVQTTILPQFLPTWKTLEIYYCEVHLDVPCLVFCFRPLTTAFKWLFLNLAILHGNSSFNIHQGWNQFLSQMPTHRNLKMAMENQPWMKNIFPIFLLNMGNFPIEMLVFGSENWTWPRQDASYHHDDITSFVRTIICHWHPGCIP